VRCFRVSRTLWLAAVTSALVVAGINGPPSAHADGDPCSDVLVTVDVCLPVAPTAPPFSTLVRRVRQLNQGGYRLKVAVIASKEDLGSIPSLFGQPRQYAQFLGLELSQVYHGNLLVVMPAGMGFYHAGRDVSVEEQALAAVRIASDATTGLASAASAGSVAAARASGPPIAAANAAGKRSLSVRLSYELVVRPTARRVKVIGTVRGPMRVIASRSVSFGVVPTGPLSMTLSLPTSVPTRLRACVQVVVAAIASRPSCVPVH
jgi:hypothetical protein